MTADTAKTVELRVRRDTKDSRDERTVQRHLRGHNKRHREGLQQIREPFTVVSAEITRESALHSGDNRHDQFIIYVNNIHAYCIDKFYLAPDSICHVRCRSLFTCCHMLFIDP